MSTVKRIVTLMLCLLMISLLLGGCNDTTEEVEVMKQKVTNVYRSDYITLPDNYSASSTSLSINSDGRVYVLCNEIIDAETYEVAPLIYSFDINGENVEIEYIEIDEFVNNDENIVSYVNNFVTTSQGEKVYLIYKSNMETSAQQRLLNMYDTDNNLIFSIDPKDHFDTTVDTSRYLGMPANSDYFSINYMRVSSDDTIYLTSDNAVVAINSDGEKLFELAIENGYINDVVTTTDGKVLLSYMDNETYQNVYKYIDADKKAFGDALEMPSSNQNISLYVGAGYELYYKDEIGVYGYNIDEEPVLLMNILNSDIIANTFNNIKIINQDKFLYVGYDYITNKQEFIILTRIPDDEVEPKIIINLSFLNASSYMLTTAVVNFNRKNDLYRIVMNDYSLLSAYTDTAYGDPTISKTQFENDILSDKIPDIMIIDSNMDLNSYVSKGLFADLYEFMDNDNDFDKDNILNCVRNAYENDGKLYYIPSTITINTLAGKTSIVGDKEGWSMNEVIKFVTEYPDSYLTSNFNKSYLFNILMTVGIHDYVDYENVTCYFDSEEFIELLNYINTFDKESFVEKLSDDERNEFWQNQNKYYSDGTILLNDVYINSFSQYLSVKFAFSNEDITFKGYPSASSNGGYISSYQLFAIADKSLCKDGAWEFLKYMISDEVISTDQWSHNGIPVTESAFYITAENAKEIYYYFRGDSYGGYMSAHTLIENSADLGYPYEMRLTDEDIEFLKNYIDNITMTRDSENELLQIISEDIEVFLAGEKSAEETAKVIQSRALIYISENS